MKEITATISSKGQVTVPAEVRRRLGVGPHDKLSFVIDGTDVVVRPAAFTIETVLGSVPALRGDSDMDFKRIAEEAWEDQVDAQAASVDAT